MHTGSSSRAEWTSVETSSNTSSCLLPGENTWSKAGRGSWHPTQGPIPLRRVGGSEGPNWKEPGDGVESPGRVGQTRQNARRLPLSSCSRLRNRRRSISSPRRRSSHSASEASQTAACWWRRHLRLAVRQRLLKPASSSPALPAGMPVPSTPPAISAVLSGALAPSPPSRPATFPAPGARHAGSPAPAGLLSLGPHRSSPVSTPSGLHPAPRAKACCWALLSWSHRCWFSWCSICLLSPQHFSSAWRSHNCPVKSQTGHLGFFPPTWEAQLLFQASGQL